MIEDNMIEAEMNDKVVMVILGAAAALVIGGILLITFLTF